MPTKPRRHKDDRVYRAGGVLAGAVLILNACFEPVRVSNVRETLKLVFKGAATVIENHPTAVVRAARESYPAPSVVRLTEYRYIPKVSRAVTKRAIVLRDGSCCQYCLREFPSSELTKDHVIPISRGGPTSFTNLVAACKKCNNHKANRTPEEAGMVLARRPVELSIHARHRLHAGKFNPSWDKFLFV